MRAKNAITLFLSLVFVFVAATVATGADERFSPTEEHQFNRLMNAASQKGHVRVIVEIKVPDIGRLTANSTRFKTGHQYKALIQEAVNADLELEQAITTAREDILYRLNGTRYNVNRTYNSLPALALTVTPESLAALYELPVINRIYEDVPMRHQIRDSSQFTRDDDGTNVSRPQLQTSTGIVGANNAWNLGYTGAGWYVAILDTGLRTTHEMFQGKTIVEQCYALGDDWYDKENGSCPNGSTEMSGTGSAAPFQDRFYHGTHVAGVAAGNNHNDRFGVGRDANVIAINVFSYFPSEDDVLSWSSDQIKGLEYVYNNRHNYPIAAANMSLGGSTQYTDYCSTSLRADAIANLRAAGIATVISSGNSGFCGGVNDPACIPGAITVGGTDKQDMAWHFGNWHDEMVDLLAPGVSIVSALSTGDVDYAPKNGTSFSAPHVTGAWAIIKQYDPAMSIDDITTLFQESGNMIANPNCSGSAERPRLDVGDAIMSLLAVAPPKNLMIEQKENKSLLQTEYINILKWESNPLNSSRTINAYRIYIVNGGQFNQVIEVSGSTFEYWHRMQTQGAAITYAITSVDDTGEESLPLYYEFSGE